LGRGEIFFEADLSEAPTDSIFKIFQYVFRFLILNTHLNLNLKFKFICTSTTKLQHVMLVLFYQLSHPVICDIISNMQCTHEMFKEIWC
jgi:predicted CDP-diglyceride synthetase/phosphatidate cytidylyltransferase